MEEKKRKRFSTGATTISTLYFRGERQIKDRKKENRSLLTFEKALERLRAQKEKQ